MLLALRTIVRQYLLSDVMLDQPITLFHYAIMRPYQLLQNSDLYNEMQSIT